MRIFDENTGLLEDLLNVGEKLETMMRNIIAKSEFKQRYSILDNQDVCFLLNTTKRHLQYLRSKGKIAYFKIDQKVYYKKTDILEYIERNKIQ